MNENVTKSNKVKDDKDAKQEQQVLFTCIHGIVTLIFLFETYTFATSSVGYTYSIFFPYNPTIQASGYILVHRLPV